MGNELPSRDKYAKKVADLIRKNHNQSAESSFIFGLSGKWGEGKTFFITELLKIHLKEFDFVYINPWKFAAERHSFLRYFLQEISREGGKESNSHLGFNAWLEKRRIGTRLRMLFNDVSYTEINWGLLLLFVGSVVAFYIFLHFLPVEITNSLQNLWTKSGVFLTFLITTICIPIFLKIFSFNRSSKAVSTINQFDDLFNQIIESKVNKKTVIIVDDLDRVTPKIARNVLDNLRTFFDEPRLSFIVTGDHTVLERYIGSQILPEGDLPEQIEEGRRYLKKIFNVYWKIPLPINEEFEPFLQAQLKQLKDNTDIWTEGDIETLKSYFVKYFDKNFRHTERFIETIEFTFDIALLQKEDAKPEELPLYTALIENPLLVVRVLLIQEFCAPVFDYILQSTSAFADAERAIAKGSEAAVNKLIEDTKNLAPSQKQFIQRFMREKPRFWDDTGSLLVPSIDPFLFLAADSGMGDLRGPAPEDFASSLSTGNAEQVEANIKGSGIDQLKIIAPKAAGFIRDRSSESPDDSLAAIKTLVEALCQVDQKNQAHSIFANNLKSVDLTFTHNMASEKRMELILALWKWLDLMRSSDVPEEFASRFPFRSHDDFQFIDLGQEQSGSFSSQVLSNWLVEFYKSNPHHGLKQIEEFQSRISEDELRRHLQNIMPQLVADFLNEGDDQFRTLRLHIVERFAEEAEKDSLRTGICNKIQAADQSWRSFVFDQTEGSTLLDSDYLEQCLILKIQSSPDMPSMIESISFARDKVESRNEQLWKVLLGEKVDLFKQILKHLASDPENANIAPPRAKAKDLYNLITKETVATEDAGLISDYIEFLRREHWFWQNLEERPDTRNLNGLRKKNDLRERIAEMDETWKGS